MYFAGLKGFPSSFGLIVNTFKGVVGAVLNNDGVLPYLVIPIDSNAKAIGTAPPSMYWE